MGTLPDPRHQGAAIPIERVDFSEVFGRYVKLVVHTFHGMAVAVQYVQIDRNEIGGAATTPGN